MTRPRLLGVLVLSLLLELERGPGWGHQQQPEPTPGLQQKEKQRDEELRQVNQLLRGGKRTEATALLEKLSRLEADLFAGQPAKRLPVLQTLADLLDGAESWKRAEEVRQEVLTLQEKRLGKEHWEATDARQALEHTQFQRDLTAEQRRQWHQVHQLSQQGLQNYQRGDLRGALPLLKQAQELARTLLGENHPFYAQHLNNLASLYQDLGDYPRAMPLAEQAGQLRKTHLGEAHPAYAQSLTELASLYQAMGDYDRALPLAEKACQLRKKLHGEEHLDYAATLNNLAFLCKVMGDYSRALPLYQQAHDLLKKLAGESHPAYSTSLNNLAVLHQAMGNYSQALPLAEQACEVSKKWLGENHPNHARNLNNLGLLYHELGDYPRALPLYEQARSLRQKVLGENHPAYATSLNNLAGLYKDMGNNARALALFEQAQALRQKLHGENHPDTILSLNNLASHYLTMGNLARGLPLAERARDLSKTQLGENHPAYATSLNNLAKFYLSQGDTARALTLAEQACSLCRKLYGENHPLYALCLNNVAASWNERDNPSRAQPLFEQSLQIQAGFLRSGFNLQSERERLALLQRQRSSLDNYLTFAATHRLPAEQVYSLVLDWKGLVSARRTAELALRHNPQLQDLFDRLHSASTRLSHLAFSSPAPNQLPAWKRQLDQLRQEKETLERQLADKTRSLPEWQSRRVLPEEVARALPANTALIDWLAYQSGREPQQNGQEGTKPELLAFVLCPGQPIQMVRFEEVPAIYRALASWRLAAQENQGPALAQAAAVLQRLLWQPLQKHLRSAKTLLLAPDGELARFPFAALPGSKPGSFLIEELTLGYLFSGKQLVELQEPNNQSPRASRGLLAVGGVDYGPLPPGKEGWQPLPRTGLEALRARQRFETAFAPERGTLLEGREASVAKLKEEAGKHYRVLHLATHGFFESPVRLVARMRGLRGGAGNWSPESPGQAVDVMELLPLLKNGLVLTGANQGGGVLSSEEVETLDLRGCELVTLSACATGLGELRGGEGVLGLQRSFHAAGARTVCCSLWDVNDAATSVLMEQFYANLWQRGLPPLEALRQAQLFVLKNRNEVVRQGGQLKADLLQRGVPAEVLAARGLGKEAGMLPREGQEAASPVAWWAAFVLSGAAR